MHSNKKFIVSHPPFVHNGSRVSARSYATMIAALPALLVGMAQYGMPALGVVSLAISSAILWELLMNRIQKQKPTIGDGNAALIGLILAMLLPATAPWWLVVMGSFLAVVIGKQIFGGIGSNPFNPAVMALAIMMVSWKDLFDFNEILVHYDLGFTMAYPLATAKHFGASAVETMSNWDLLIGRQSGAIGSTFGLGLIAGGVYLMLQGIIRWEISISFLAGVFITALIFNISDPARYAGAFFHLFTGYTLIGAFFLATEDSSSPVNTIPMILCGVGAGIMTVLIRNIGAYIDGVVFAILLLNVVNPLVDRIRPKTTGKGVKNA
jgi:Na+-translocating ferredoxin:NAD+ oxidoreductase subunit D